MATYTIINQLRLCNNTTVVRLLYERVSCYVAVRRYLGAHGTRRDNVSRRPLARLSASRCRDGGAMVSCHPSGVYGGHSVTLQPLPLSPPPKPPPPPLPPFPLLPPLSLPCPQIQTPPPIRTYRGRKVELPEGVHGVVLREKPCPEAVREENEDVTSFWAAETSFRNVAVRNQDVTRPRRSPALFCLFLLVLVGGVVQEKRGCYVPTPACAIERRDAY